MIKKRPFTLTRVHHGETSSWYVLFRDPQTGKRMNKKSIEVLRKEMGDQTVEPLLRKEDAEALCARYLERSLHTAPTQRTVASYMMEFYDWDTSPYIARRRTLDPESISRDYMATRKNLLLNHAIPLFPPTLTLDHLTVGVLEDLQYHLVASGKLAKNTVNMIMQAVLFALREAQRRGEIPQQVLLSIQPLKAKERIRGVMTETETHAYLQAAKNMQNKRIWLSATLSLLTGMRSGELRALDVCQIGDGFITIDRAYADLHGEKRPKGKKTRIVPCPQFLCDQLREFAHTNPYRRKETLVFWSAKGGSYVSSHYFCEIFHRALREAHILTKEEISQRNITFHSFRHMANTLLRGSVDEYVLRMTIGHSSEQLSDLYTHLSQKALENVALAQKNNILPLVEISDAETPKPGND